jgi:orotidine-5'-phosphate decarboxylase
MKLNEMDLNDPRNRIAVALDNMTSMLDVEKTVGLLADKVGYFKVGFQLIHSLGGPQVVNVIKNNGGKIFYDCKLHYTHDTMKVSAENIANLGVDIFNVHASATIRAMVAANEMSGNAIVAAVSVLTSISEEECHHVYGKSIISKVEEFANDIVEARLPAIICSPEEARMVKNNLKTSGLITITPAIRPLWAVPDDQNKDRIMTPTKAIKSGSDILVIGRPILQPPLEIGNPIEAVKRIIEEIEDALVHM